MNRVASILLCAVAVACQGGGDAGPQALSMNGTWRQSGDLRDQATGDSHIHLGTFALTQTGSQFGGTGQQSGICTGAHGNYEGPLANPAPFAVTAGQLSGRRVSFERDICHFQGDFEAGRNDRITGTATCSYVLNNVSYSFSGQWQADRQ